MDKILLFAPAGQYLTEENALDTVRLDRIAAGIRAKGFALRELPSVRSVETRFAGSDEVRLADAVAALADDSADLALALRGGFGSQCLLPNLPWDELASGRTLLTGYSDVTVLLNALWTHTGRTTLHGPVGGDFDPERRIEGDLFGALSRAAAAFGPRNEAWRFSFVPEAAYAEGGRRTSGEAASFTEDLTLWGGNLTMLTTLAGTPHVPTRRLAGRPLRGLPRRRPRDEPSGRLRLRDGACALCEDPAGSQVLYGSSRRTRCEARNASRRGDASARVRRPSRDAYEVRNRKCRSPKPLRSTF